ncbi:unnamed protein product [Cuscuta epithymum]|uniref:Uncharacterized protein n=1 Tax=Cuscuta epithymum TaxID=186058 RepID=A0AAV0DBS7_9ASTE|nr:unnamed protein product [Cuscuta epithymum]
MSLVLFCLDASGFILKEMTTGLLGLINQSKFMTTGPTVMAEVHNRKIEERPIIILNEVGQPIGPTPDLVREFSRFLGTVARDSELTPLNYVTWHNVPQHNLDNIWDYVMEKYMVPMEGQKWVFSTINDLWRVHKSRMKKAHYYAYTTNEERWKNRPKTIPENIFKDLVNYWNVDEVEEASDINRSNRMQYDDPHTLGPTSFALLRHVLKQDDPNNQDPSQATLYKESRLRTPGNQYLTKNDKASENIKQMSELQSQQECGEKETKEDPYYLVVKKPELNGRLRLRGRGMNKSKLKKSNKGAKSSYTLPEEFLQSVTAKLIPNIRANMKEEVAQDVASMVLSQMKAANPGITLNIPEFCISARDKSTHELDGSNGKSNANDELDDEDELQQLE